MPTHYSTFSIQRTFADIDFSEKLAFNIMATMSRYSTTTYGCFACYHLNSPYKLVGCLFAQDLSILGRDLNHICIIDNSPYSYIFQPDNAVPILSWFNDPNDCQLMQLLPVLDAMVDADNICTVIANLHQYIQNMQNMPSPQETPPLQPTTAPDNHGTLQQI